MSSFLARLPTIRLSLTWRFAIAALVVFVVLGYVLVRLLGQVITDNALENTRAETRDTLARRVLNQLSPEDLAAPMTGQRLADFQRFVEESVVSHRTARIKVWNAEGRVIYSDDPDLIGQTFPIDDQRAAAFAGETVSELSHASEAETASEAEHGDLLEVYTPIVFPGSQEVVGAFEIYQIYEPVAQQIAETRRYVTFSLGGGLGVLYLALLGIVHGGSRTIERQRRELEGAFKTELRRAVTDPLTGLANHRGALAQLQAAVKRARSQAGSLSLIIGDFDGLKRFNDTYGHVAGDDVLKLVADIFRRSCGPGDTACRYGGDEYLLILRGKDRSDALTLASQVAETIGQAEFRTEAGERIPISMSLGLASMPQDADTTDKLIASAEAAMYAAKWRGAETDARTSKIAGPRATDTMFGVLDSLVQAIDAKDHYTKRHSDVVAEYGAKLAARLNLSDEVRRALRMAGLLHDVGKLVVPDQILKKPGSLNSDEYDEMKRHVVIGEVLIREVPQLKDVIQAVSCHHERYDGSGYPRGLQAEQIPLVGRIIEIADAYSAMRLDRPYRKALSLDEVIQELREGAGTQFDPELVRVFIDLLLEERSLKQKAA